MSRIFDRLGSSIRLKLVVLTVIPISLIFILFEVYGSRLQLQEVEAEREAILEQDAALMSARLNRQLNSLTEIAEFNARSIENFFAFTSDDIFDLVAETVRVHPLVFGAAVAFDAYAFTDDMELFSPYAYTSATSISTMDIGDIRDDQGYNYMDGTWEWWSTPAVTGMPSWSAPYLDEGAGNTLMVTYSVPFFREGDFRGVVTIDIELQTMFSSMGLSTGNRMVVKNNGEYVFHPDVENILSGSLFDMDDRYAINDMTSLRTSIQLQDEGVAYLTKDTGGRDWLAYYHIPSTNWHFIDIMSEQSILEPIRQMQQYALIKSVLAIFSVMILIWWISGFVTKPVTQLSDAAQRVSQGDFSARLTSSARDELGRLTRLFTVMSDMIANREYELAQQVEERTRELRLSQREIINQKQELEDKVEELHELTHQLEEARNLAEVASESKAIFLASMSHEIRTPLNGILGFVDLLRLADLKPEHKDMLRIVHSSGQALLTIINDILDISKIEAGKLNLELIPFNLQEVVESSMDIVATNAAQKDLKVFTYIDPELPGTLIGDPVRIRQILINLIGNGIKFTGSGSVSVLVSGEKVKPDCYLVRFDVVDTGIGISPEGQQKLFKAFSQAESSTTRQYGGTGLGLSICERLSTMMGGSVDVKSKLGMGSTFTVEVPLQVEATTEGKVNDFLAGIQVLVVTDNPVETKVLSRYLETSGADVSVLSDINDSRYFIEQRQSDFDLVFNIVVLGSVWASEMQDRKCKELSGLPACENTRFVTISQEKRSQTTQPTGNQVKIETGPLKKGTFLTAVAIAAGRESPEIYTDSDTETYDASVQPTVEEAMLKNQLILVAEDNVTNRHVISRQLAHLGYACEFAENGRQGLDAWKTGKFAVVLSDCHMPVMDGFEMTAAIRELEEGTDKRTPIIAVTANALSGEEQNCLNAGMDDYLSKPVNLEVLGKKLKKWLPDAEPQQTAQVEIEKAEDDEKSGGAENIENGVATSDCPLDEQILLSMFGDDKGLIKEILDEYVVPSRELVNEIMMGVGQQNADDVKNAAHKLKSASGSIGAMKLADISQKLETAASENDFVTMQAQAKILPSAFRVVADYIQANQV